MGVDVRTVVGAPLPATAVVVDLRGFTAELNRTRDEDGSREAFCGFLADMNEAVVTSSRIALHPGLRDQTDELVHVGATGDGALIVFTHPEHHQVHGFAAALLMRRFLEKDCERYNQLGQGQMDFGIGVESGTVRTVGAYGPQTLATYIGTCINVAARVQDLTKTIDRTHIVFGSSIVDGMLHTLFADSRARLGEERRSGSVSDEEYLAYERRRIALNRRLCINFLHMHRLRGFDVPTQLFRLSRSSGVLDNPRFEELLTRLTSSDAGWLADVRSLLA